MSNNELEILKARIDVLQTYLNDSVKEIKKDFETLFDSIVKALNMMDARLAAVEHALMGAAVPTETPAESTRTDNSGKEL